MNTGEEGLRAHGPHEQVNPNALYTPCLEEFPLIRDSTPGIPKKGIQTDAEKKALIMEYIEQT